MRAGVRAICRKTRSPRSSLKVSARLVLSVVLDTQIILRGSSSARPTITGKIYEAWRAGDFALLLSEPILEEIEDEALSVAILTTTYFSSAPSRVMPTTLSPPMTIS